MRIYATVEDFAASPLTSGTVTEQALAAASRVVDELLLTACYDVDDQGMPTDPKVVDALKQATCA